MEEQVFDNYKGIKGWFPESQIKLMNEFLYVKEQKMMLKLLWGIDADEKQIEKYKKDYKNQQNHEGLHPSIEKWNK